MHKFITSLNKEKTFLDVGLKLILKMRRNRLAKALHKLKKNNQFKNLAFSVNNVGTDRLVNFHIINRLSSKIQFKLFKEQFLTSQKQL